MLDLKNISGPGDAYAAVMMLVICLLIGAIPVVKMIGWWAEGYVDGFTAFFGILLFVVGTVFAILMPPGAGIFLILLMLGCAIAAPLLGRIADENQLKSMEQDRVDSYVAVLERDPLNHPARTGLAEALYKRGEVDLAIQHMEWVLQQAPALSFRYKPILETWKRQRERNQGEYTPPIICHRCQAENASTATSCEVCAVAFGTRTGVMQQINYQGGPKVVLRGWIVAAVTAIVCLFVLLTMPSIIAGPIILASVIMAAWLFVRWVGGDMGTVEE